MDCAVVAGAVKRTGFKKPTFKRRPSPRLAPIELPDNVRPMAASGSVERIQKRAVVKSNAIRSSARGEQCTVQIVGVCDCSTTTTVLAHLPSEIAHSKSTDMCAVYACHACHDAIDRRVTNAEFELCRWFYLLRALVRTNTRLLERGLITVTGHN